jgi:hypothetical protein
MLSALKSLSQADLVAAINELLAAVRGGEEEEKRVNGNRVSPSYFFLFFLSFLFPLTLRPLLKKKKTLKKTPKSKIARPRRPSSLRWPRDLQGHSPR